MIVINFEIKDYEILEFSIKMYFMKGLILEYSLLN